MSVLSSQEERIRCELGPREHSVLAADTTPQSRKAFYIREQLQQELEALRHADSCKSWNVDELDEDGDTVPYLIPTGENFAQMRALYEKGPDRKWPARLRGSPYGGPNAHRQVCSCE